jgi:hypothetical protein
MSPTEGPIGSDAKGAGVAERIAARMYGRLRDIPKGE